VSRGLVKQALSLAARIGADPQDSDEVRVKKAIVSVGLSVAIVVLLTFMGPLYLLFHEPVVAFSYIGFALLAALNLALFHWRRLTYGQTIFVLGAVVMPIHLFVHVMLGGFVNSGGITLWGLVFPVLVVLICYDERRAVPWFAAYLVNNFIAVFAQPWLNPASRLPTVVTLIVFATNIMMLSSFAFIILAYFVRQRDMAYRLLRGEQEKSENLLLNILPREIAAILKNENRVIANHFDGASILFADVVNFTPLSAQMTPVELVELLNEVFSHFDALVEKYGLEKIKTIGDCYMVASGVPRPRADHAQTLTGMALEMQAFVNGREFHGRKLAFRIGINSGPVVAGVIGRKKFIYDLWGDAVNTASRMESHGAGGLIQITRATYELIKDDFICEPRGVVDVKGKGEMEVWQVINSRSA